MENNYIIRGNFEKKKTSLVLSVIGVINIIIGIAFSIWVFFNENTKYYYSYYPVKQYEYVPYYKCDKYYLFFFHEGRHEGFGYFIVLGLLFILTAIIISWRIGKCNLTITDKFIKGQTFTGSKITLPTETITAIEEVKLFNGIKIISASKKITFTSLNNAQDICKVISQLIVRDDKYEKEENKINSSTNVDELKKYKELLDIGAITQEEFEAKKKELLN